MQVKENCASDWENYMVGRSAQRPLGRQRHGWVDNNKMILEIGWGDTDWNGIIQDRDKLRDLVNVVMNLHVSYAGNLLTGCTTGDLLSNAELHKVVEWVLQVMLPFACSFIADVFVLN
jgi:hypothetical protein